MTKHDDTPAGYWLYRRVGGLGQSTSLYVPNTLKGPLLAEDERRLQEEIAKRDADNLQSPRAAEHSIGSDNGKQAAIPPSPAMAPKTKAEEDLEKEQVVWQAIDARDAKRRARDTYVVFKSDQALALFKSFGSGDSEAKERLKLIYDALVRRGSTRRRIGQPKSMASLQELARKQPHMQEVVHYVQDQLELARLSRKPLRLQPMLLVGEAGVGKTHFAQSLAKALETSVHIQPLDVDLTNSFLLGSDNKWSNSQHGLLFELLVLGQHANPVIVLDELDKVQRGLNYGTPLASLHSLLEPVSAQAVRDISLRFQFDASLVTWIATANHVVQLDAPLRSRFKEFHIMPPDAHGCLVLAEEVMRAAIDSAGIQGFSTDVGLRRHLAHLPARQIWQLTREAMGRAVSSGRKQLQAQDLPPWLLDPGNSHDSNPTSRMH